VHLDTARHVHGLRPVQAKSLAAGMVLALGGCPAPGHDDDGVFEGDLPALAVCDDAVVQDLQQDVEHICVSLQHEGVACYACTISGLDI
jgi:hypothetical protein